MVTPRVRHVEVHFLAANQLLNQLDRKCIELKQAMEEFLGCLFQVHDLRAVSHPADRTERPLAVLLAPRLFNLVDLGDREVNDVEHLDLVALVHDQLLLKHGLDLIHHVGLVVVGILMGTLQEVKAFLAILFLFVFKEFGNRVSDLGIKHFLLFTLSDSPLLALKHKIFHFHLQLPELLDTLRVIG